MKKAASFRLSQDARDLLVMIARNLSISQTAVLEIIVREKARTEYVSLISVSSLSNKDTD